MRIPNGLFHYHITHDPTLTDLSADKEAAADVVTALNVFTSGLPDLRRRFVLKDNMLCASWVEKATQSEITTLVMDRNALTHYYDRGYIQSIDTMKLPTVLRKPNLVTVWAKDRILIALYVDPRQELGRSLPQVMHTVNICAIDYPIDTQNWTQEGI